MNYSSNDFARLCQGEDVDIRYKDVFLYYRFLKQPEQMPKEFKSPNQLTKITQFVQKAKSKFKRVIA
jgi:hypothetical protein